ncbi:hypothetical protein J7I98_25110 [Streptomyces sp. ISL-98]|uniref:hypothetical protein n=1 Tax=Streptomyces sp. ISL-98 TaxID=2819192 RepID=UPI001BECBE42|nr:hypothetical protein [Streptomyces sp. ISL-98]MBT2509109.1 hypothetical protein [Streptomyces sp. ISL-98]
MESGLPQASGASKILDGLLTFMPDWVQITFIVLVVVVVLVSWAVKIKRKIEYRRAVRAGRPVHAAAQHGQGRGADYLGSYAPVDGDRR